MIKALAIGLAAAASITLGGCASESQLVSNEEDLLAAAGFTISPTNTPERQATMAQLPPNSFVRQANGDQVTYLYADPLVCNCLYVGDQQAYGRYQQEVLQREAARQQELTAQLNAQAAWGWGASGRGPGWW